MAGRMSKNKLASSKFSEKKSTKKAKYRSKEGKTKKPSSRNFLECKICGERFYQIDTGKLYYHLLFEHKMSSFIEIKYEEGKGALGEKKYICKFCGEEIYRQTGEKWSFRYEEHLYAKHKLIEFFDNQAVDQTTQMIELVCPNAWCGETREHTYYGTGRLWVSKEQWINGQAQVLCPDCLMELVPSEELKEKNKEERISGQIL